MPLGIVSNNDFLLELDRLNNPKTETSPKLEIPDKKESDSKNDPNLTDKDQGKVVTIESGRGLGSVAVPSVLRNLIGITSVESGRTEALTLAREFGVSDSSVSAYSKGAHSTASYNQPNPELKRKVDTSKERIGRIARGKLLQSLREITPTKLADAKLRDVAAVATAMSAVVKNMEPEREVANNNVNFVFFSPKLKSEDAYDVIELQDEQ